MDHRPTFGRGRSRGRGRGRGGPRPPWGTTGYNHHRKGAQGFSPRSPRWHHQASHNMYSAGIQWMRPPPFPCTVSIPSNFQPPHHHVDPWLKQPTGYFTTDTIYVSRGYESSSMSPDAPPFISMEQSQQKFNDAAKAQRDNIQRAISSHVEEDYESSEEEEEMNDEQIINSMTKAFKVTGTEDLGSTRDWLQTSMTSKANVCLICIETIRRAQQIWSCNCCYSIFHIPCIQRWGKDAAYQSGADEDGGGGEVEWHCPKCRHSFRLYELPTRYFCYCGKTQDPDVDPWLVPHSCGQICGRKLKPDCGHHCTLLCHPGPCPPCPQSVRAGCHCGAADVIVRRCANREWSCGAVCGKTLACGKHTCEATCHAGECGECSSSSSRSCRCGRSREVPRLCQEAEWTCEQPCGRAFSCGEHVCEKVCHVGACGSCPRLGARTCPCGQTSVSLPCTEDPPTCARTCGKQLDCGRHCCTQRCHNGPCGTCRQMVQKSCRCGARRREVPCFREFLCDTKCVKIRDCGKHQCKRRCCDGQCPPCEVDCGRTLTCKNHKCASVCHRGACYPCSQSSSLTCQCGGTSVSVPCGRERHLKPPVCRLPCRRSGSCHHSVPHRCHDGDCPPCRQVCGKVLPCGHCCGVRCHAAVLTEFTEERTRAGPWEPALLKRVESVEQPCPPCPSPVPVTCLGGHDTSDMPCSEAKPRSCGRECGRLLSCTNHNCELECHSVSEDQGCTACERPCRKRSCAHPCTQPCHEGSCAPCNADLRMRCHCALVVKHLPCHKWTESTAGARERLKCCGGLCPKTLSCGHTCKQFCHSGECPGPDICTDKVKLRCPCRRRKEEYICNETKDVVMKCDEVCDQLKEHRRQQQMAEERVRRESEEAKAQAELDEYERKLRVKRRKPKKQMEAAEVQGFYDKYKMKYVLPILVAILAVFCVYYFALKTVESDEKETEQK